MSAITDGEEVHPGVVLRAARACAERQRSVSDIPLSDELAAVQEQPAVTFDLRIEVEPYGERVRVTVDADRSLLRPIVSVVRDTEREAVVAAMMQAAHSVADEIAEL